jgi:hypothetical protein
MVLRLMVHTVVLCVWSFVLSVPSVGAQGGGSMDAARLDAQTESGIERYRAGAHQDAIRLLTAAVAARPDDQAAQLYLGLSYVWLGEEASATRHLIALRALPVTPRLSAQLDYVLEGMKAGPLSPPLRRFVALALDETMSLERSPRRPPFAESLLRRNFPYFP